VWSPEDGTTITEKGTLTVTGKAWDGEHPAFPLDPVLDPINNGDGDGTYYVVWTGDPSALNYTLEEADNPSFGSATRYDDATSPKYIYDQTPGTYHYRVKAHNMDGDSRWSNVESVTVLQATQAPGFPSLLAMPSAPAGPAKVAASEPVTVWVRVDDSAWQTATVTANAGGWWDWKYGWSLSEEDGVQHIIQTQAYDEASNVSAVDTVTVTVDNTGYVTYLPFMFKRWPPIPYPPDLDDIANDDGDGDYTVSWTYGYTDPPASTYTLQEATDADFGDPTEYYPGSSTTQAISGKSTGTYYYRVRGHNTWGAGEWSNTRSVTVQALLHDDFDDPSTGWATRRTSSPDLALAGTAYSNGKLITRMDDKFDFGLSSPMNPAPARPYSIRMRTRIIHHANEASYGIIFGGNSGTPCPVARSNAGDANGCFFHYYRLNVIWGGYLKCQVKRIDYHEAEKGKARGVELLPWTDLYNITSPDGWNNWEVKVYDNGFSVYVNGNLIGWTSDTTYVNELYYGILTSTFEYNSASFEHEYYYVDPLSAGETLPGSGYLVPGTTNWYRPFPQPHQFSPEPLP